MDDPAPFFKRPRRRNPRPQRRRNPGLRIPPPARRIVLHRCRQRHRQTQSRGRNRALGTRRRRPSHRRWLRQPPRPHRPETPLRTRLRTHHPPPPQLRPLELWRGRMVRPEPCPERRFGSMRARRLSKPSAVTRPAATSSQSPVSTSALSLPVPLTTSMKNDAPRWRRNSKTWIAPSLRPRVAPPWSLEEWRGIIHSASSRAKKVTGATLVAMTRRLPWAESSSVAVWLVRRPQPTAPVRQS